MEMYIWIVKNSKNTNKIKINYISDTIVYINIISTSHDNERELVS